MFQCGRELDPFPMGGGGGIIRRRILWRIWRENFRGVVGGRENFQQTNLVFLLVGLKLF